jgi:hypothetical protein
VTIDLFNNLTASQVNDVSQNLSDLSFTLSGTFATGLVTDTNRTYTGTQTFNLFLRSLSVAREPLRRADNGTIADSAETGVVITTARVS